MFTVFAQPKMRAVYQGIHDILSCFKKLMFWKKRRKYIPKNTKLSIVIIQYRQIQTVTERVIIIKKDLLEKAGLKIDLEVSSWFYINHSKQVEYAYMKQLKKVVK